MTKQEAGTLIAIVAKFKQIADDEFGGRIYDNVLTIFNKLKTNEKRIFLKGLVNTCFIVEGKVLVSTEDLMDLKNAILETRDKIESQTREPIDAVVEDTNKALLTRQLLSLKKLVVIAMIVISSAVVLGLLIVGSANATFTESVSLVSNFISLFTDVLS